MRKVHINMLFLENSHSRTLENVNVGILKLYAVYYLYVCVFAGLFICMRICWPIYMYAYLLAYLYVCVFAGLFICMRICWPIYMYAYLLAYNFVVCIGTQPIITKTCPCIIQRFFTAVKMKNFK